MKKRSILLTIISIIFTACGVPKSVPTPTISSPSHTPTLGFTASPTATFTPIFVPTFTPTIIQPTPTPTFTPFPPYPTKKVVFEYSSGDNWGWIAGDDAYFQSFDGDAFFSRELILYEDGQMLADGGQKILSADEMKKFFAKLDALGFFSLESDGMHDEEDKLYNFGNQYSKSSDGPEACISVNLDTPKRLCAYLPYKQFLVPEMVTMLKYFRDYKPTGLTPYYPDRILLSTRPANPDTDDLSGNAPVWDKHFPSLAFSLPNAYNIPVTIRYIQGDMAKEIDRFMEKYHNSGVFIQDGKKYIVKWIIVLPDEKVTNAYQ